MTKIKGNIKRRRNKIFIRLLAIFFVLFLPFIMGSEMMDIYKKGEIKIDFGKYKYVDLHRKKFFKGSLFGIFERKDTDDTVVELLKMILK